MDFDYSPRTRELQAQVLKFMADHIYPAEAEFARELAANTAAGKRWTPLKLIEGLKVKAQAAGLWNLFLPVDSAAASGYSGAGLTNQEYAPLAEIMGRVFWASEVFNCSAPDTGNMETIARYGSTENKERWLKPLLEGKIRSAFAMTKTDPDAPRHSQQSMVLVPANTPGLKVVRPLDVFGYDDAPHGHMEVLFENVRVPASNILLGEGRGFEIAQGRLGPGRNKVAKAEIAMIKVVAPTMACDVIDWAIQVHGGGGVSGDFPLAYAYANARTLRFADGPDEVHRNSIAKLELGKYSASPRAVEMPVTRGC